MLTEPSSEFSQHVLTEPGSEFLQHALTEPSSEFSQHVLTEPSSEFLQHVLTEPSSEFSQLALTEPSSESEFPKHLSTEPSSEFFQYLTTEPSSESVNDDGDDSDWSYDADLTGISESDMCDFDFRCYSHSLDDKSYAARTMVESGLSLCTCATCHTNSIGLHAPIFVNGLNAHRPVFTSLHAPALINGSNAHLSMFTSMHAPAPEYPNTYMPLNQDQMPTNDESCSPLSMMCRNSVSMTPLLTDGLPDDEAPLPDEGPG